MDVQYVAVVNIEDQYSIWPKAKELPDGWQLTGKEGSKQECLSFIDEVWVDIRPKSIREARV